jgi:hypothetical protein
MNGKWIKTLRVITRIWSGVIIGFGILIAIGEIIEAQTMELNPYPWYENLMPLSMFLGIVGLGVAWKREGIGGVMAILFAVTNLALYIYTGRTSVGVVALISSTVAIPGLLYLICWWGSRSTGPP